MTKYKELVIDTYAEFEAAYGAPRITQELNDAGFPCSENYIAKIMAEQGIRGRSGRGSDTLGTA